MSNELVPVDLQNLPVSQYVTDDKVFGELATAAAWHPRVQLMTFSSTEVTNDRAKAGHYVTIKNKDQITDLGPEFDCLVLGVRAMALSINGDEVISVYDHTSALFKDIAAKSGEQDSGCMYGPQFLLWVPGHGFVTFFFSNPTLRRSAPELRGLIKKAATIKSRKIEKGKYKWHGMVVTVCSSFDGSQLPGADVILAEVTRFNNPPKQEEVVEAGGEAERAR